MKLLTKINIRYVVWSLVVMAFSGVAIFFALSGIIDRELDEQLTLSLHRVENHLIKNGQTGYRDPFISITNAEEKIEKTIFSDTLILNEEENEYEAFRQISSVKNIGGNFYLITIGKSKIESEDLLATLVLVTVLAMLILTFTLILVNRKVAQSVWKEFYYNLEQMKNFTLSKQEKLKLQSTNIHEFSELNTILENLATHVITDYQNLKQFTEDASHEIQTPLAIINSQMETLLDDPGLTQQHSEMVGKIYNSVRRLSKLNKELVLLMKIDNKQFPVSGTAKLAQVFIDKIVEFAELIELKNLAIETNFNGNFEVEMPGLLAEILANNLLMNSINHNLKGGKIIIETDDSFLKISNSGTAAITRPEMLFNRFYKENVSSNSVGLGLAIVKRICDNYSLSIDYSFSENAHTFTLTNSL